MKFFTYRSNILDPNIKFINLMPVENIPMLVNILKKSATDYKNCDRFDN